MADNNPSSDSDDNRSEHILSKLESSHMDQIPPPYQGNDDEPLREPRSKTDTALETHTKPKRQGITGKKDCRKTRSETTKDCATANLCLTSQHSASETHGLTRDNYSKLEKIPEKHPWPPEQHNFSNPDCDTAEMRDQSSYSHKKQGRKPKLTPVDRKPKPVQTKSRPRVAATPKV